ncbi:MAG TPA: SAM-dependent methyltransferase [Microlunatus sp.]|nr:SAM-dependent methyltransferase [Microlunatus sp.]
MTRSGAAPDHGDSPAGADVARASLTRVSDAMLGGKDNFRVDRDVQARMLALDPEFARATFDRRAFVLRVARHLTAEAGITQFLYCGTTLPEDENTHDIAQRASSESSTVYISTDVTVLAHGRALLANNDRAHMAEADFRDPGQVLRHPTVTKYLDFDQPIGVFHVGTMHHVPDSADPARVFAAYVDAISSGSYVAVAQFLAPDPGDELADLAGELTKLYDESGASAWFRTREQITGMLSGLDLLEPGLVPLADWWPDGPRVRPLGPTQRIAVGGLGRKP